MILIVMALILAIPFLAMQFTEEVSWDLADFIIMFILLLGTGLACDLILRKTKNRRSGILVCVLVVVVFLLIWAELGVGVFGTPFAGS